jgi:alpha-L-fucosidase
MAVHHDNFDLWDSKHHKWNSVNMGPKKDIVGLLRQATLKHGLRFGVTTHLARSYSWFNTSKGADKTGPLKGVPYDGNDPAYADFYFPKHDDSNIMHPLNPPAEVRENWLLRMKDLVDRYEPDHFYLDGGIPFRGDDEFRTGMALMSHYYNASIARHGRLDAVFCIKDNDRRYGELSHGLYVDGVATLDIERGRADRIRAEPWQTDTSIGDWFYRRGDRYRSAGDVIHELADIVSKNGNLLLNVPPRADGSLDRETVSILKGIGQWMTVNREAIYATRPWQRFGEDDVRFTTKDDALYAVSLKWPERELLIKCLGTDAAGKAVRSVDLLGHDTTLVFQQDAAGLRITLPVKKPCAHAYSFRIEFSAH